MVICASVFAENWGRFHSPLTPFAWGEKFLRSLRVIKNVRKARTSNQDRIDNPCYTSYRDPGKKVRLTAGQRNWNETFKNICAATRDRMMDPNFLPTDQVGFIRQTKYKTFYQYVWNVVRQEIENGK